LGFQLKFNTGMNRLGLEPRLLADVRAWLSRARARSRGGGARLEGVCTHFAIAEEPGAALTRAQAVSELRRVAGSQLDPAVVEALVETLDGAP
jgi:alanine racemase